MSTEVALPGMEALVESTHGRPGDQDLSDAKRYTGEVLYRDHPDVFRAVAAAFFIDKLPVRTIAARYKVSVNTIRAIRDMALESPATDAARAAFFAKSQAEKLQGMIRTRALEAILDRLTDPEEVKKLGVDTLTELAKFGVQEQQGKARPYSTEPEVIDVDAFDAVMNGLQAEKKSAREDGSQTGVENGADCSTPNDSGVHNSVGLSEDNQ